MQQIILQTNNSEKVMPLLNDLIQGETLRLNHSFSLARKRLKQFESKYKIYCFNFGFLWHGNCLNCQTKAWGTGLWEYIAVFEKTKVETVYLQSSL